MNVVCRKVSIVLPHIVSRSPSIHLKANKYRRHPEKDKKTHEFEYQKKFIKTVKISRMNLNLSLVHTCTHLAWDSSKTNQWEKIYNYLNLIWDYSIYPQDYINNHPNHFFFVNSMHLSDQTYLRKNDRHIYLLFLDFMWVWSLQGFYTFWDRLLGKVLLHKTSSASQSVDFYNNIKTNHYDIIYESMIVNSNFKSLWFSNLKFKSIGDDLDREGPKKPHSNEYYSNSVLV